MRRGALPATSPSCQTYLNGTNNPRRGFSPPFTGADDEKVLRVPSVPGSKAPEYCLAQQYSGLGNDALPADCKFPMRPLGPLLR